MANRYWIGGAGNWNDAAHWSATSGGTGGASVPTMNDDVYFDSNSGTGTVTVNAIANMLDLTFMNIGAIKLNNAAFNFNVYGSLTLHSNLTVNFTGTGYLYLKAVDARTMTTNGKVANWNRLYFDGIGGTWTNMDDMNCSVTNITHNNGTWLTNNKTIYCKNYQVFTGIKALSLGSTIFNCEDWNVGSGVVNYTFNCGTSNINCLSNDFLGGGLIYNNVYIECPITIYIMGTNTFNNLTILGGADSYVDINQTINNNLILSGMNATVNRFLLKSDKIGTPRIFTCNGTVTASNVDFRDITLAGTCNKDLSDIPGGSGDCGGNSGITFTPSQTQYHYRAAAGGSNWGTASLWFTATNGGGSAGRVPLPQDDAIFDENSFPAGSSLYVNVPRICRSLDMSGVDTALTMTLGNGIEVYGSFVLGNNITLIGNYSLDLIGNGNYNLNLFNKPKSAYIYVKRGNYTSLSDIILVAEVSNQFSVQNSASFDFNGFNFSGILLYTNTSGTLNLGSGIFEIISNSTAWSGYVSIANTTNLISDKSTIIFKTNTNPTNDNPRLYGLNRVFGKVIFSGNTTKSQTVESSCSINELIIAAGKTLKFTNGTTQTIGKLTAIGTPGKPITIGSTTPGQRHTLNYTGNEASTVEYCNISDSKVTEARRLLAKNSVNGGNNQNWGFNTLPPFALNKKQVDKMYVGDKLVTAIYKGTNKIY